jgi:acyl-coenzyme A synthetase/AMP-(fatty) acid ligase/acyl carrier protein
VIYTSGSTGNPKGVLSIHKGIINRLLWMQQEYKLSPNDTVLQKTPYSFDVSVWEFFWPLLSGAKLVIARPGGHMDPKYLHKIIRSSSITTLHFVPSMLQVFLAESELHDCTTLRQVFCSGEALPYKLQEKFFSSVAQHARLHNLYGPTEASVDVTYWECSRTDTRKLVPIGRPIANTEMHILDERLNPVAVGEVGELFIGGVGLARGYLNRPELTESRFIPNPLDKHSRSQRLYKTGDSARWLDDGSIEYLGRLDFQVKIRGVRIELGEIESALSEHSGVRECVVVASDFDGDKRLVAYIIPNETCKDTPHKDLVHQMRIFLHEKLPEAMVPSHFVTLDSFPKTVSGKVDRKKLPTPETNHSELSTSIPISNQDEKMAQIWKNILHVNDIGADDNFFDAGGHSLLIPAIISKISEIFGTTIEMVDFFQAPTIRSLSALLQQKSVSSSPQPQDDRIAKQRRALYGKTKSV